MSDVNPARLAAWLQRQNPSFSCPADDMTLEYCARYEHTHSAHIVLPAIQHDQPYEGLARWCLRPQSCVGGVCALCRVAEVTDASAADDLQTLTDLLNDLMSQHAPDDSALLLQPDAVTAWLRGGDDGTETDGTPHNAATAAQGPNSSEAHTLGGQSQQGVCAAATGEDTVAKQQSGFTPSPSTGPQQHQWNVSASEFVPRPPQPGHHTTDTHSPAQPTTSTTPNPPGTDAGAHADAGAWDWDQGSALHGDAHAWEGTWGDEPDTQHAARGTHGPARVTRLQGNSHAWEDRQGSALHGGTEWADTHGPAGAWEGVWGEDWGYTDDYQDYDNTHHSIAGVSGGAGLGPTGDDMNPEQLLAGMFPSYAPTLLTQLLQSHKGDISAAVDELLLLDTIEGQGTDTDTSPTTHAAYRQGTGTGQTAQAGHGGTDAAAPPQHGGGRPMQPGGPLAGDESGISGVMPLTDSDAFPALGSIGAGGTSSVGARSSQGASMGAQPAASSWAKVANSATHKAPAPAPAPPPTQPSLAAARSVSHRVGGSGLQAAAASVPRVETGVTLASQYQGARQEASDWARARNMCFQQVRVLPCFVSQARIGAS